jgi:hypothetical protein
VVRDDIYRALEMEWKRDVKKNQLSTWGPKKIIAEIKNTVGELNNKRNTQERLINDPNYLVQNSQKSVRGDKKKENV